MPKVEIDEAELVRQRALTATVSKMLANPEARSLLLQAQKKADPSVVIPEIDAAQPLRDDMAAIRKELADERAARAKEKEERDAEERRKAFADEWSAKKRGLSEAGYTDEGITAIEKLAEERGIPDLDAAAALFDKMHPPAAPAQPSASGAWGFLDMPTDGDNDSQMFKKMLESKGEDDSLLNGLIKDTLNQVRGVGPVRR